MYRVPKLAVLMFVALALGGLGCENGGVFLYSPFGLLITKNPANNGGGGDGGNHTVIINTNTYDGPTLDAPDNTAVRIWLEADGSTTLSVCVWTGSGFDCDPSIKEILADNGLTLLALTFDIDGQAHDCSDGEGAINVGNLPYDICATATAVVEDSNHKIFVIEWPKNCR